MHAKSDSKLLALSFLMLSACGGDDGGSVMTQAPAGAPPPPAAPPPPVTPAEATTLQAKLASDMAGGVRSMAMVESGGVYTLVPGMPLTPSIVIANDTSAGAPPNSYTFKGTYDGTGKGMLETTLDGRIAFVNNPTDFDAGFNGAQGSVSVGIDVIGLLHVYRGNFSYAMGMTEHRVSGSGTFTNPLIGNTTTLTINPSEPLTMKPADGSSNARANACAHSFNGPMQISIAGPTGTLSSLWRFAYGSTSVASSGTTYTDTAGRTIALPDSTVELGCGSGGSINDWSGRFRIQWACLPQEHGEFNTTITVKNATTLTMIDDGDTPAEAYEASMVGTSPRAIRGFFVDGPTGSRYREDFNWTLKPDGTGFSQISVYRYTEGPQTGRGGMCAARATRI